MSGPASTPVSPASVRSRKKFPWRRRLLFLAAIVVGILLFAEAASFSALYLLQGPPSRVADSRRREVPRDPIHARVRELPVMIHPYVGVVLHPAEDAGDAERIDRDLANEWGFPGIRSPVRTRSDDRVVVAIVGGSVARHMAFNASHTLEQELSQIPQLAGRTFEFVRLAVDGYKQPQQLMAVSYLMTMGGQFDLVINLDGVNEAALPKIDNVPFGVAAVYPRKWGTLVNAADSADVARTLGYITFLRHRQRRWAKACEAFPLRYSMAGLLLWKTVSDRRDREILKQLNRLDALCSEDVNRVASGPSEAFASDEELYARCVEIWVRSSIQLHLLCAGSGARYFHFLQPNQHLDPPTKPFAPSEVPMTRAGSPFHEPIRQCYPRMRAAGERLAEAGVSFHDLTNVFADHPEPLYLDDCCHVSPAGDEIMARAIGTTIRESW